MGASLMVDIGGQRLYPNHRSNGWALRGEGLLDWADSPDSRDDDEPIPGGDGSFEPSDSPLLEAKRVTVLGSHRATSMEWSVFQARSWLASLAKSRDLGFRVWQGGTWLSLRGARIRGRVRVVEVPGLSTRTNFELTVWTADPRKYGPTRSIEMAAIAEPVGGLRFPIVDGALDFAMEGLTEFPGVFRIENPGTAEFFPERFVVGGPIEGFTITSEQSTVEYDGPIGAGDELVLTPYAGGRATLNGADVSHNLIRADWVAVQPGETRGYLFSPVDPQPGSKLTIDYPEGAWW